MTEVHVRFRGMEPSEELVGAAREWVAALAARRPPPRSLAADVLIDRCAPQWGGSTTARVRLTVDGIDAVEVSQSKEPRHALQACFAAVTRGLRSGTSSGAPTDTTSPRSETFLG